MFDWHQPFQRLVWARNVTVSRNYHCFLLHAPFFRNDYLWVSTCTVALYSSHYDFKMVFYWFVCGRGNSVCSQVLKSGLIQRGNGAFWPCHWVCCHFTPEGKCQAWVFVLWIWFVLLKMCLWVAFSMEKWRYKTRFLANWNLFIQQSFSFTEAVEGKLPLAQKWLSAADEQPWYFAGMWSTSLCFWKQTLYHQPGDRGLSHFIQLQMNSCLLSLLQRHQEVAFALELPSVPLAGEKSVPQLLLARLGQAFDLLLKVYELLWEAATNIHCALSVGD